MCLDDGEPKRKISQKITGDIANMLFLTEVISLVFFSSTVQKKIIGTFKCDSFRPDVFIHVNAPLYLDTGKYPDSKDIADVPFVEWEDYSSMTKSDEIPYTECLGLLATYYLQSMVFETPDFGPEYWVDESVQLLKHRWESIKAPLQLTSGGYVVQKKENRELDRAYFVTHVIFFANNYGTRPLHSPYYSKPYYISRKWAGYLFKLLTLWYNQLTEGGEEKGIYHKNLEIFLEICYSLLYLNESRQYQLPETFFTYHKLLLEKGVQFEFHKADEKKILGERESTKSKKEVSAAVKNVFFPNDSRMDFFFSDYHVHTVLAFYLTECYKYLSVDHTAKTLRNQGWCVIKATRSKHLETIQLTIENMTKLTNRFPNNNDVIIQTTGKYENEVIKPKQKSKKRGKGEGIDDQVKKFLLMTDNFWSMVHERIAEGLGIPPNKIKIFEDMTYLRIKGGKEGSTPAHADFYYFVRKTDLFERVYSPSRSYCNVCKKKPKATDASICKNCAEHKQFPLYTAWISLGDYNNNESSLLQFLKGSTHIQYPLHPENFRLDLPKQLKKNEEWVFPTDSGLKQGDMVLFNCKAVHMAKSGLPGTKRLSIDVRFAILDN